MIKGIDHVELRVKDLNRALAFYKEKLGLIDHTPNDRMHFLGTESEAFVVLVGGREEGGSSAHEVLDHLAFSVPAVEQARDSLREKGIVFISDRTDSDGGGRSYYFRDPDGNTLEVYGPLKAG